jgi:hypothetical protein
MRTEISLLAECDYFCGRKHQSDRKYLENMFITYISLKLSAPLMILGEINLVDGILWEGKGVVRLVPLFL